jgi:hypothetical protein
VGLSIYVSSSKEKLISFLDSELKETIPGELKIDKTEITVWETFPRIGIVLDNVTISDSVYRKPFLKAETITAKVGFLGLAGHKLRINSVKIEDAILFAFTDAKGYSNRYVVKPQNRTGRKSKKPLVLRNLELENVIAISENAIKNKRYELKIYDADIDMTVRGSRYHISLDEDILIRGLAFNLSKGYWLENQRLQAKWKLEFDTTGNILSFNDTKVKIEDQPFIIKGAFFFDAPGSFHIEASTSDIPYTAALAILKPTTSNKIKQLNLTEPLAVSVLLDGPLAYKTTPLMKVNFSTTHNNVKTPVMNFNDCNFSGSFINEVDPGLPRSDSNSKVSINEFISKWGDIELKAKNIIVNNLVDPSIQFEFFSQCTLPQLDDQLSSSTLRFLDGNAKLYLAYNGPLIADPSLLDQLNAKIQIQHGKVVYMPRNLTFSECNGGVLIMGNNLMVNNFQCNLNSNHFVLNINGRDLNRFSSNNPGNATITCNVYSPMIDLSDFSELFAKQTNQTTKNSKKSFGNTTNAIDNAVENGDLFVNLKAQQLFMHHFQASNVTANVAFKNNDWEIKQASLQHADGNVSLTAKLHQVNNEFDQVNAQADLEHINIKKLFYGFDNFGQTGITYENLEGVMDSKVNITAEINNAGRLISNTINGKVIFSLKNASLINLPALQNIQQFVLKNRDLSNVQFADLKDTFDLQNGDIYVHRMPIQSSAITMYIEGIYSFEDRTDISIQVPFSTLTTTPQDYKEIDKVKAATPGASIYLRAKSKNGKIKIGLDVFKKHRKKKHKKKG